MSLGSRVLVVAMVLAAVAAAAQTALQYPAKDPGVDSLAARAKAQRDSVGQFKVNYQFQFKDLVKESGKIGRAHV